jgi:hypothetical protein
MKLSKIAKFCPKARNMIYNPKNSKPTIVELLQNKGFPKNSKVFVVWRRRK